MTPPSGDQRRRDLLEQGYCVAHDVLDSAMLRRVTHACDAALDALPPEHRQAQRSTGSMISVYDDPFFAELVSHPPALRALRDLGFDRPAWSSGFIISKPPGGPPLFWHQDWWGWESPHSYGPAPQQFFLMYYLVDTTPENGCLRVVPGSHLSRHPLHDVVPDAHTDALRRIDDAGHPADAEAEGEVDLCVKAGDLVIGDSRILHATHANASDHRRTVITLWYHPVFHELPEPMRAALAKPNPHRDAWPGSARERIAALIPTYDGDAEPLVWNRTPSEDLRAPGIS
ncbi:phytanoyl-CoA dioxygenase [Candidatus Poribacteria bacterium]|nr:phytanoyl-CoA dioxygenase [Candidatus Poribacteria bacterium]